MEDEPKTEKTDNGRGRRGMATTTRRPAPPSPPRSPSLRPTLLLLLLSPHSADALAITTFNILAPLHRSMTSTNRRESEREDWWRPRAEGVAKYISREFSNSDVVLLQEWWFADEFARIFDEATGEIFERVAERRPGAEDGTMRDDGMCCLVKRKGELELVRSDKVLTGPQRIAQIVQCRERCADGRGRDVFIANLHLSFPGNRDRALNGRRQAGEVAIILDALDHAGRKQDVSSPPGSERLEVMCGDFNSDSRGLAASLVEGPPHDFVNCVSATAEQVLTNIGGQVNIGVTHCDHLGQRVSVDHVFLRLSKKAHSGRNSRYSDRNGTLGSRRMKEGGRCAALALGYLDTKGTRILSVRRGNMELEGAAVLSDHRPVTAKIAWPRAPPKELRAESLSEIYVNATMPLDPLEPAWGIVEPAWGVATERR